MNFIYDYFYDVLSQEGIWVLILIGAAFAVASFILLTMRTETGFKYRDTVGNMSKLKKQTKKAENQIGSSEGIEELITSGKQEKAKKAKKNKDTKAQPSVPLRPEMVPPDQPAPDVSVSVIDGLDISGMGTFGISGDPGSGISAEEADVTAAPVGSTDDLEKNIISSPVVETDPAASVIDPFAIGADLPQPEQELETPEEESGSADMEQSNSSDDIFAIFNEVDDEEVTETAMFAQELEDVKMDQMLSETESISQELKNIFNQFRRA